MFSKPASGAVWPDATFKLNVQAVFRRPEFLKIKITIPVNQARAAEPEGTVLRGVGMKEALLRISVREAVVIALLIIAVMGITMIGFGWVPHISIATVLCGLLAYGKFKGQSFTAMETKMAEGVMTGIGAIYLNDISTQFSLIDESDHYGDMKSSSVFIRENGTAGTIHHIDLSI